MFQGDKHDAMPQVVYDSRWHGQLIGWLASLTLKNEAIQELSLPQVICGYEDELLGLHPLRDVDFTIELHPSTSLISLTLQRMAPAEL